MVATILFNVNDLNIYYPYLKIIPEYNNRWAKIQG